jgi:hypothetical protein
MSRLSLFLFISFYSSLFFVDGSVCKAALNSTEWVFSANKGKSYSCASSSGGVNDMGTPGAQMCDGDPSSVRIGVTSGKSECLVASAPACKIPMHDFVSLDYEFTIDGCNGIWAAPLWLTPDTWQWGPGSGEIDSLEFCGRSEMHMNFAGGGHQVQLPANQFSIDGSTGHNTVRKDPAGIVTISTCTTQEAQNNGGHCPAPVYEDCNDCQWGTEPDGSPHPFACWCNAGANNIYGSGGCTKGTDCMWTLVSDIWNGVNGDAGYWGCMTAVPAINLPAGKPNLDSQCSFSVERILLRGSGPNESLQWGAGSPGSCAALTTDPAGAQ